jgi:DNA polymerase III epsilon subunit-like protein
MSSAQAFYFLLHESMSHGKYSWKREYLKLSLGGKRDRLEKVVEYEDKTIYRPTGLGFGLPFGVVRSSKLEYTEALLRFRKDATARKLQLEQEREQRQLADKKMSGLRGLATPKLAPLRVATTPDLVPSAALFDDFTIVDTEYQGEFLLEVAAIRYKNWEPVGKPLVSYVCCTEWIWPKTTNLTGITQEMVRAAPEEVDVFRAFMQLAEGSLLIAHNVGADRSKLEAASKRAGEPLPNSWFCTLALARARLPKGTKCGLGELVERFGFSRRGHHQALADVQMCFQVLRHFHQEQPLLSLDPKAKAAAQSQLFAA